ncbi:hypothetical protein U9M48_020844, partial [Paspalum notatum var. saurae]
QNPPRLLLPSPRTSTPLPCGGAEVHRRSDCFLLVLEHRSYPSSPARAVNRSVPAEGVGARSRQVDSILAPIMGDETASTSSPADPQTQTQDHAAAEHGVESLKRQLCRLVASSLSATGPGLDVEPMLEFSKPGFGDYQCNNAMSLFSSLRGQGTNFQNPREIGQAILNNLPPSEIVESTSVAGPGYVNIVISSDWIAEKIQGMLINGIKTWAPTMPVKRVIVDFSSPNIAKEMHVGHIRSTIIGDALARMLEFANVEVLRRNHVGDWGTQFGMLIEFLFEQFPNWEEVGSQAIGDLQSFYKASKVKFDDEESGFKVKAQQAVVRLQQGEDKYRAAWRKIYQISRKEFDSVYKRLGVELEEKGESFYNPYICPVLEELTSKGLVTERTWFKCWSLDHSVYIRGTELAS